MCCLFGLIDTRQQYSGAEKARMLHALATAAEARGTDAAGYACNGSGGLIVRKSPVPGHKLRFTVSDDTVTVMGHTRMTTQGDARRNRNNHPFAGSINGARFAFAHNGVIYNDHELRERFALPHTKIETDSYIAVQLLETQNALGFDALRFAAEQLEGSFTFTALGEQNDLYIVKGDNPLNLIRFPETGLFLYASTREILEKALESCSQRANNGVWERMESGEMLKIDSAGVVTRSRFDDSKLLGWYAPYSYACTPRYRSDGSYVGELKAVAYAFGYTPAMIDRLILRGFQPEEIEEMLYQM